MENAGRGFGFVIQAVVVVLVVVVWSVRCFER